MSIAEEKLKMAVDHFSSVVHEILSILSNYTSMINTDVDECYLCMDKINEYETYVTCESCNNDFHVTCKEYVNNNKFADQRLIWICSCCGYSNIGDRIFDRECIPSHYNRYEPLMEADDDDDDDDDNSNKNIKTFKQTRQVKGARKRYVKEKKSTVLTDQCSRYENGVTDNLSQNLLSEEFDNSWVKVKCKRAKLMARKREERLQSNSEQRNDQGKRQERSVNGVLLEPGVTYIGTAFKTFYGSRKRKNTVQKKENDENHKMKNEEKHVGVQSYAETLLSIYACSVKSPLSMKFCNDASKEFEKMQNRSYANVTTKLSPLSKPDSAKHSNRRTCNILGKMKDLRRYRVHAGGKQRNKKGQPTYHDRREERITLGRYLLNRLMHVDNRCQKGGECLSDILEKQEGKNKGYQQEPKHQQCDNSSWGLLPDLRLLDRFSSNDLGPCRSVHSVQSHSFMQFHSIGLY